MRNYLYQIIKNINSIQKKIEYHIFEFFLLYVNSGYIILKPSKCVQSKCLNKNNKIKCNHMKKKKKALTSK